MGGKILNERIPLEYDKKWVILQLIELLRAKNVICEELWFEIKRNIIAYFTNT